MDAMDITSVLIEAIGSYISAIMFVYQAAAENQNGRPANFAIFLAMAGLTLTLQLWPLWVVLMITGAMPVEQAGRLLVIGSLLFIVLPIVVLMVWCITLPAAAHVNPVAVGRQVEGETTEQTTPTQEDP